MLLTEFNILNNMNGFERYIIFPITLNVINVLLLSDHQVLLSVF